MISQQKGGEKPNLDNKSGILAMRAGIQKPSAQSAIKIGIYLFIPNSEKNIVFEFAK